MYLHFFRGLPYHLYSVSVYIEILVELVLDPNTACLTSWEIFKYFLLLSGFSIKTWWKLRSSQNDDDAKNEKSYKKN